MDFRGFGEGDFMNIFTRLMEKLSGKAGGLGGGRRRGPTRVSIEELKQAILADPKPIVSCAQEGSASGAASASRFGGGPAWLSGEPALLGKNGRPMIFLLQINFAEAPALEGFPDTGLLQFFVEDDDVNGCEFPSKTGEGFAVIYRENTDGLVLCDQYQAGLPEFSPILNESVMRDGRDLRFETGNMYPTGAAIAAELYADAVSHGGDTTELNKFYDWLDALPSAAIYLGGHPKFTQSDIREDSRWVNYDTVLLQIGWTDDIMWGDAGEACFLIRKEDLNARRFENAIYNWDCC